MKIFDSFENLKMFNGKINSDLFDQYSERMGNQ